MNQSQRMLCAAGVFVLIGLVCEQVETERKSRLASQSYVSDRVTRLECALAAVWLDAHPDDKDLVELNRRLEGTL